MSIMVQAFISRVVVTCMMWCVVAGQPSHPHTGRLRDDSESRSRSPRLSDRTSDSCAKTIKYFAPIRVLRVNIFFNMQEIGILLESQSFGPAHWQPSDLTNPEHRCLPCNISGRPCNNWSGAGCLGGAGHCVRLQRCEFFIDLRFRRWCPTASRLR